MSEPFRWLLATASPSGWVHDVARATGAVVVAALLFVVLRWLILRALDAVMRPFLARAARESDSSLARIETLRALARSSITYTLLFLAVVTVLGGLGVNVAAILTGAGVAGLALSFGAQRLVRDVLTGFFLLLEDQFRVGEMVTLVGGPGLPQLTGTVMEMGLRISRLRDASGKIVTIGNGDIAAVINHSRGPVTATVELGVAPDTPLSRVQEVLERLALPESLFAGAAELAGVAALEAGRTVLRIAAPSQPGKAPEAELALRRAAAEALRAAGIEIR